jgi:hypothetical protein
LKVDRKDPYLNEAIEVLDRHIERAKGDSRLAYTYLSKSETDFVIQEVERCLDFRYYSENYHVIQSEFEGLKCLFPWWESQEILYGYVLEEQAAGRPVKLLVLKARQEGISEFSQAMLFHKTIFTEACNTLIVAQEPKQSDYIFGKSRSALSALPWWMRPEVRYEEAGYQIVFDRRRDIDRMMDPGLQSRIIVESANKMSGVSVGKTIRACHLTELAEWYNPGVFSQDINPTMNAPDLLAIAESTAKGRTGFWYRYYKAAMKSNIDGWRAVFIEFFRVKKYSLPIPKDVKFELTEDEVKLREKVKKEASHVLTNEQFYWRREKIKVFIAADGDEWKFFEQYPLNWVEAFQSSGRCAFDRRKLQKMLETQCVPPKWYGEISLDRDKGKIRPAVRLTEVSDGSIVPPAEFYGSRLYVWEQPEDGAEYYLGADVAAGIVGMDYSCAQILKIGRGLNPDVQVAEWHGWINPTPFAGVVAALGYWYRTCEVSVEGNSDVGGMTNQELMRVIEYPNIFLWKHYDKVKNFVTSFFGWYTNRKSRGQLITAWKEAIDDGTIIIRSENLIDECLDFTNEDGGKRFEAGEENDDRLFGGMISRWCAHDMDWGMENSRPNSDGEEETPEQRARKKRMDYANTEYSPLFDGAHRKTGKTSAPTSVIQIADAVAENYFNSRSSSGTTAPGDDWKLT